MENYNFFTKIFNQLSTEELENYHKTVFMYMDTPFAMEKRSVAVGVPARVIRKREEKRKKCQ